MSMVNIADLKNELSKYLRKLKSGEVLTICKNNTPIAELKKLDTPKKRTPQIGFDKGRLHVPPSFFEPLPEEMTSAFLGE